MKIKEEWIKIIDIVSICFGILSMIMIIGFSRAMNLFYINILFLALAMFTAIKNKSRLSIGAIAVNLIPILFVAFLFFALG